MDSSHQLTSQRGGGNRSIAQCGDTQETILCAVAVWTSGAVGMGYIVRLSVYSSVCVSDRNRSISPEPLNH